MAHDTIPSTSFKNFNRVSNFKELLKEKSLLRVQGSELFDSLKVRKKWQKENELDFLDLNLEVRLQQKTKIEEFLLNNENALRASLDLPTYQTYKEFVEREDDPEVLDVDSEILEEAANILIDLIEIKNKPLLASNFVTKSS